MLSMLAKFSILRNWEFHRWKNHRFYSTTRHNEHYPLPQVVSQNILITNSARKGRLGIARKIFDEMPTRTVVSFNTMISGYSQWGMLEEAIDIVSMMHRCCMKLNETTFSSVLSVCARLRSLEDGKQIHGLVLKSGSEDFDLVGSSLLNFYASCYEIWEARKVFDLLHERNRLLWNLMLVSYVHCNLLMDAMEVFKSMPIRDVIAWTSLISGYSNSEDKCRKAVELFQLMRMSEEGTKPNEFTFDSVLRACGRSGEFYEGMIVHGLLISYGFEFDPSLTGALIEFYCNCSAIEDAMKAFERLDNPCSNSLNTLLGGLLSMGKIEEAEKIFGRINEMNPVLYNLMIKGYAVIGQPEDSKRLFNEMSQRTVVTSNIMISVYSQNRELDEAVRLFEMTKVERNTVTWNSMMSGYVQNDRPEEALKLYVTMHRLAIEWNRSTFSTLFHACSCLGSLQQGKLLHAHVSKTSFESNVYVGTSLVDMYSKCGSITDAKTSFLGIHSANVAAWTCLIHGYAHYGLGTEAILLFQQMLQQGIHPNEVTFVGLLLACGRGGLVDEGMQIFSSMEGSYGVVPTVEHYACIVDLLGRAGNLKDAEKFINEMPVEADAVVWATLLSACWFWKDEEVGERVAKRMLCFDPKQISVYVIISNIYAGSGKWEQVVKVRKRLRNMAVKKDPGCSWIEVKNTFNVFSVEDRTHPMSDEIYASLESLIGNINPSIEFDYVDNG